MGEIRIRQRSIFSAEEEQSGKLLVGTVRRLMNRLHINTRKWVIRRELLFRTGDPLRPNLLAETERNLRSLGFINDIRVQPTDTLGGGRVPVEVSLRES